MKPYISFHLLLLASILVITACSESKKNEAIHFATSAQYPPFEYNDQGKLKGFDIQLAQLIAKELGKEAVFDNMQFSTVLPAVNSGQDEVAIATITITEERKKNFDFTEPYYFESMAIVYNSTQPIKHPGQLNGKKVAVQLGTVMEIWLHQHYPNIEVTALDSNNQAIEALLAGHVDTVLMDGAQGLVFSKKHPGLSYSMLANAENGYALALKKGSSLTAQINTALQKLKAKGEIQTLETYWLKGNL